MEKGREIGQGNACVCYAHSQKHAAYIWRPEVDTVCSFITPYLVFKIEGP